MRRLAQTSDPKSGIVSALAIFSQQFVTVASHSQIPLFHFVSDTKQTEEEPGHNGNERNHNRQ
jgi:hypothetical protein